MKKIITLIAVCSIVLFSCKTKKEATTTDNKSTTTSSQISGKVSHQYRATGCSTVILVNQIAEDGTQSELVLIPKDKLDASYDKDNLEIKFDYHPLKMHNPEGCNVGMPAEIINISKK